MEQETAATKAELEQLKYSQCYDNIRLYLDGYEEFKKSKSELESKVPNYGEAGKQVIETASREADQKRQHIACRWRGIPGTVFTVVGGTGVAD